MWREPATRYAAVLASIVLALTGVAGCSSTTVIVPSTCPSVYTAAVAWTSKMARSSVIQFFNGDQVVAEIKVPVRNIQWGDQAPVYHDGTVALLSMGDPSFGDASLITIHLATCVVNVMDLHSMEMNLGSFRDGFLTVGNLNGSSHVTGFTAVRASVTTSFEGQIITVAQGDGDRVYAIGTTIDTRETSLIVLSADDLAVVKTVPLPMLSLGAAVSMTFVAGKVIIPLGTTHLRTTDAEDNRLIVVDQTDWSVRTIKLDQLSPFLVRTVGDTVYVAHTFMNQGFHDWSFYRYVSTLNAANEIPTTHTLGSPIARFDVTATRLAALSGSDANDVPVLHTYALPDFTPITTVALKPPKNVPYPVAVNVFLSPSA